MASGWVATHEDITEQRRAEKELERAKSFFDTVLENVPVTIFVKDAKDFTYLLINRAGEEYHGIPREQISTDNYNVSADTRIDKTGQNAVVAGYVVTNVVRVEVRRIEQGSHLTLNPGP